MGTKLLNLIAKANTNITKMKITGLPRLFLLSYATLLLYFGFIYAVSVTIEFIRTGLLNYAAVTNFIAVFFGTATVATMVIIGKALIDKNEDGIPDKWEEGTKDDTSK